MKNLPESDGNQPTEAEVRKLRAAIYGEVSDMAWSKVRDNWIKPNNVSWLRSQPQNQSKKWALYDTH